MIDVSSLKGRDKSGGGWEGQCPACAADGLDKTGNHLVVFPDGKFACVVNNGPGGKYHRQRIFRMIGVKKKIQRPDPLKVRVMIRVGGALKTR
jgi:hypothetical protein